MSDRAVSRVIRRPPTPEQKAARKAERECRAAATPTLARGAKVHGDRGTTPNQRAALIGLGVVKNRPATIEQEEAARQRVAKRLDAKQVAGQMGVFDVLAADDVIHCVGTNGEGA